MKDIDIKQATVLEIEAVWRRWGLPIVTVDRVYSPTDVEGLVALRANRTVLGLVTWSRENGFAEIVSLDSFIESQGLGSRLLESAEATLRSMGVNQVRVITTNDSLQALTFYLRRSYRLRIVHVDAMDRVRRIKPSVSRTSDTGLPVSDMWELEKKL